MNPKKIAAALGLVMAIAGFANFIAEIRFSFGYQWYVPFYLSFRPFAIRLPFVPYPVDILFCMGLLVASLLFLLRDRGFRALAFLSALILAQQGTKLLVLIFRFLLKLSDGQLPVNNLLVHLLLAGSAVYILLVFKRTWEHTGHSEKQEASKWQRFGGYCIDMFIFIFMMLAYPYGESKLAIIALMFVFYFAFETVYLVTPGKILLNTRVETESGEPPKDTTILVRTLSRFIPLESVSFLFGTGLHDRLSKTRVVRYK